MKKIIAMLIVLVGILAACTNQVTTENSTGSAVLDRIYKKQKNRHRNDSGLSAV